MEPIETGNRTGRESVRMPNQEATMPAACSALGEGWPRNTIGTTGCRFTAES